MLSYINRSRDRYKAQPLKLDILASRVANKQSKGAAEKGFSGHWNTAGEKPYHRYAFTGGVDHGAENAASYWSSVHYYAQSHASMPRPFHGRTGSKRRTQKECHRKAPYPRRPWILPHRIGLQVL